jgi:hypothetical protein
MTSRTLRVGLLASAGLAVILLAGCNVLEGDGKATDKNSAPATSAASTPPSDGTITLAEAATFGLPLPSPRRREGTPLRVASIDPKQSMAALKTTMTAQDLAGVFLQYDVGLAAAEKSTLNTPKEMRRVLAQLRYSTPEGMSNGWYAMRALVASKDPQFIKGVNAQVISKGREKFLEMLASEKFVNKIPGAGSATQAVIAAVALENTRLASISAKFKDTAARFQKNKYGMQMPLPEEPVTRMAVQEPRSLAGSVKAVMAALSPISEAQAAYSPSVMADILALAARKIATDHMAGGTPAAGAVVTAASKETTHCLSWARLNLNQCVAAAHFPSEEAWCTGKHAVDDVRMCWSSVLPASMTAATPATAVVKPKK